MNNARLQRLLREHPGEMCTWRIRDLSAAIGLRGKVRHILNVARACGVEVDVYESRFLLSSSWDGTLRGTSEMLLRVARELGEME